MFTVVVVAMAQRVLTPGGDMEAAVAHALVSEVCL